VVNTCKILVIYTGFGYPADMNVIERGTDHGTSGWPWVSNKGDGVVCHLDLKFLSYVLDSQS
jgi:hypothetical protein